MSMLKNIECTECQYCKIKNIIIAMKYVQKIQNAKNVNVVKYVDRPQQGLDVNNSRLQPTQFTWARWDECQKHVNNVKYFTHLRCQLQIGATAADVMVGWQYVCQYTNVNSL